MSSLPPLQLMNKWREEGLDPEQVKALADTWVKEARQALKQPQQQPKPKPEPKVKPEPAARAKPGPKPGIPRRFPPRPKDGRSKPAPQKRRVSKLPSLEILVELYQTHTIQEIATMYKASTSSVGLQLKKADAVAQKRLARQKAREEKEVQKQGRGNAKLPDQARLEELYNDHTLKEIGLMYGATTEAVAYHLRKTGAIERKRVEQAAADLAQIRAMRGQGLPWYKIAQALGRSEGYLSQLAKEAGIKTPKRPLICPECDRDPYARGLCRRCYEYARTHKTELSQEERDRVEARAAAVAGGPGRYHRGMKAETLEKARLVQALRRQGKTYREIREIAGISTSQACMLAQIEIGVNPEQ